MALESATRKKLFPFFDNFFFENVDETTTTPNCMRDVYNTTILLLHYSVALMNYN